MTPEMNSQFGVSDQLSLQALPSVYLEFPLVTEMNMKSSHHQLLYINIFQEFTKVKLWADGWNYNQVTQIRKKP